MPTKPTLIDTHCHLNFERYDADRDDIVQKAIDNGVTRIIIPAVDIESAEQALALSEQYEGVFVAVGVHPNSTADFDADDLAKIEALSHHEKVISIGEIGIDYHWDKSPKAKQRESFEAQLELASQRELPVIIHNREASEDVMDVLEQWVKNLPESLKERPGVLHSFSAPPEIAERALAIGFYLGFTGPITFKNAEDLRRVVRTVPLHRILVETDGPFLTPHPYRGKRNKPEYIPLIADRLAGLHNLSLEDMARQTTENAIRLFNLPSN
ncbi:MAG: TatD family hydrolase [Phototrophicaceae bacterium]